MISIRFTENNNFYVRFTGNGRAEFNKYVNIIFKNFKDIATYYPGEDYGWAFYKSYLDKVISVFNSYGITYLNEARPLPWDNIGSNMLLSPYDYQKEAIYNAVNMEEALLVLPCGAGKTPIMVGTFLEAQEQGVIEGQGLIIVKASLKSQWQKEVSKFSNYKANILKTYADRCSKFTSKIKKLDKEIASLKVGPERKALVDKRTELETEADMFFVEQFNNCELLIANYETLTDNKVMQELLARDIQFVGADEIHYAKTHTAARSKAMYMLSNAKMKIGATATPITKDPRDVFGIFSFISPDVFGTFNKFSARYIKWAGHGKINGFKNEDQLKELVSPKMFLKTKEEVASQLPSLRVIQEYIDLDNKQVDMYERILQELDELNEQDFKIRSKCKSEAEAKLNEELQKIEAKTMALQTFAQELADSPLLLEQSDSDMSKEYFVKIKSNNKLDYCMELVSQIISSGEKVCIFSRYQRMQSILTEAIKKIDSSIGIAYVNGSLNSEQRYKEVYEKFKEDDNCKVIIMSDAGAEGINLGFCKYLIEYEPAVSYAIQTQRHGRLERADSKHKDVTVYQLIANNSWDEIARKIIDKKQGFDESIIKSIAR